MSDLNVLLIEDEPHLLKHLSARLIDAGMKVVPFSSMRAFENFYPTVEQKIDIIVLDRLLHGEDSALKIQEIRNRHPGSGVIVISAINSTVEKVSLLDQGVDDYLSKPFESEELIARMRAIARRADGEKMLCFKDIGLSLEDRLIKVGNEKVSIPNKEFILLKILIDVPGRIVSKNELQQGVWANDPEVESNVVEVTIGKLRKRLKEMKSEISIRNSRNIGYWVEV